MSHRLLRSTAVLRTPDDVGAASVCPQTPVSLDAFQWCVVAAIGNGRRVAELVAALQVGLDELEAVLDDLVAARLVTITPPADPDEGRARATTAQPATDGGMRFFSPRAAAAVAATTTTPLPLSRIDPDEIASRRMLEKFLASRRAS